MRATTLEILVLEPWNELAYEQALERQHALSREGRAGWLLFCCPPTYTMGLRADSGDVLVSEAMLEARGARLLRVDRGGEVTFHGPGQVIGFPFGTLEQHTGDSRAVRAFVHDLKHRLEKVLEVELGTGALDGSTPDDTAGVWLAPRGAEARRKIVSIGIAFGRDGIRHGFALNLRPLDEWFGLIHPCGEKGALPGAALAAGATAEDERRLLGRLVDILRAGRSNQVL